MSIQFLPRNNAEIYKSNSHNAFVVDVSSFGNSPYDKLSPFTYSRNFKIPVPGVKDRFSQSVEGIWQGLKIIDDVTDESLFDKKPEKRKGNVTGHKFGDEILDLKNARVNIYFPSYFFYLDNYAPKDALDNLLNEERRGKKVIVYDVNDTADVGSSQPLAHASVLATYLNLKILQSEIIANSREEQTLLTILNEKSDNGKKIRKVLRLRNNPEIKKAIDYFCKQHPKTHNDYIVGKELSRL
jgi:hypothetical protein